MHTFTAREASCCWIMEGIRCVFKDSVYEAYSNYNCGGNQICLRTVFPLIPVPGYISWSDGADGLSLLMRENRIRRIAKRKTSADVMW